MFRRTTIILLVLAIATGVLLAPQEKLRKNLDDRPTSAVSRLPIMGEGGIDAASQDFTGDLIPVLERDVIRALDHPPWVSARALSGSVYSASTEIIGVTIGGESRAYPLRVLSVHEIVNDTLGRTPIVVTFCPLCFSGVVYDRRVGGAARTFGVSGILLNSNLVMYDRERDSLWAQITGEAVGGPDAGALLKRIQFLQTNWDCWLREHPNSSVLELEALGGLDKYPADRFDSYYRSSQSGLIPLRDRDDMDPKAFVIGVQIDGVSRAYPLDSLAGAVVNDRLADQPLAVVVDQDGHSARVFRRQVGEQPVNLEYINETDVLVDNETGFQWSAESGVALGRSADLEQVESTVSFWFAWAAFFPDTEVYEAVASTLP